MTSQTIAPEPVLELTDITFRRDGNEIIRGVSFTVRVGEHWAMLGPNGAGNRAHWHHRDHRNGTALAADSGGGRPAAALIEQLGLDAKAAQRWNVLSQGERGRVLIARALICQPRLLLLDEPSTGLDIAAREQLLESVDLLAETHPDVASVLVTRHLEELPSSTTHALLLADGQVVAAGPAGDAITSGNVSAAFEHPIDVWYHDGRWSARAARRQRTGDLSLR